MVQARGLRGLLLAVLLLLPHGTRGAAQQEVQQQVRVFGLALLSAMNKCCLIGLRTAPASCQAAYYNRHLTVTQVRLRRAALLTHKSAGAGAWNLRRVTPQLSILPLMPQVHGLWRGRQLTQDSSAKRLLRGSGTQSGTKHADGAALDAVWQRRRQRNPHADHLSEAVQGRAPDEGEQLRNGFQPGLLFSGRSLLQTSPPVSQSRVPCAIQATSVTVLVWGCLRIMGEFCIAPKRAFSCLCQRC